MDWKEYIKTLQLKKPIKVNDIFINFAEDKLIIQIKTPFRDKNVLNMFGGLRKYASITNFKNK